MCCKSILNHDKPVVISGWFCSVPGCMKSRQLSNDSSPCLNKEIPSSKMQGFSRIRSQLQFTLDPHRSYYQTYEEQMHENHALVGHYNRPGKCSTLTIVLVTVAQIIRPRKKYCLFPVTVRKKLGR